MIAQISRVKVLSKLVDMIVIVGRQKDSRVGRSLSEVVKVKKYMVLNFGKAFSRTLLPVQPRIGSSQLMNLFGARQYSQLKRVVREETAQEEVTSCPAFATAVNRNVAILPSYFPPDSFHHFACVVVCLCLSNSSMPTLVEAFSSGIGVTNYWIISRPVLRTQLGLGFPLQLLLIVTKQTRETRVKMDRQRIETFIQSVEAITDQSSFVPGT